MEQVDKVANNDFNFEEFQTRNGPSPEEPMVSLRMNGRIALNKWAYFGMGGPEAVVFLYDRQKNVLGLRSAKRGSPNTYSVSQASANSLTYVITVKAPLRHFGIPVQRSHFTPIVTEGNLVVKLDEPISRVLAPVEPDDVKEKGSV